MNRVRGALRWLAGMAWSGCLVACVAVAAAERPTAYPLRVGSELEYEVRLGDWLNGPDGKPQIPRLPDGTPKYENSRLQVFVTAQHADGSFRLVMKRLSLAGHPLLTDARLFPDGRLEENPETMPTLCEDGFRSIFPRLPPLDIAPQGTWREEFARTGLQAVYHCDGEDIVGDISGPLDRVAEGRIQWRYRRKPSGWPARIEVQGYWKSYGETRESLITLIREETHDAAWAASLDAAATLYFQAQDQSRRKLGRENARANALAVQSGQSPERLLDEARTILTSAAQRLQHPVVRQEMDLAIAQFDRYRPGRIQDLTGGSRQINQPSPDWRAPDLEGRERSLSEFRGQVLVLDFWFRKCTYCIRAMPMVEQAADHFRELRAPVTFCSICTDDDPADPRYVVDTLKIRMPVVRAPEIADKYGIDRFPRILVIDREGRLQWLFGGFSTTLREDLIAAIDQTLKP